MDAAKNFAKGTLTTGYDDVVTSIVLNAGDGAKFPAAPFNAVWWNSTDHPDPADDQFAEIVRVTAKSTDTFTISRGQEGTGNPGVAGNSHDLEGKVYKLIAPLTAKTINENLLDVTKTGNDYEIASVGILAVDVDVFIANAPTSAELNASGMVVRLQPGTAGLGDVDENNSGAALLIDDGTGVVGHRGKFGTNQTASATTLGSVTKKMEVFDNAGTSLGFIPIYGSIT